MILSLFRKDPLKEAADALYAAALSQARTPEFYQDFGVDDSIEGRFEVASIHVYLIFRRLKGAGDDAPRLSQQIFDTYFSNLDHSLRESGVGDLSVGRKIRALAESFYGRIGAYESAMADGAPADALASAVARNVYRLPEPDASASALADYMNAAASSLSTQPTGRIKAGVIEFPSPARPQ